MSAGSINEHGELIDPDGATYAGDVEVYRPLIWDPTKGIDKIAEALAQAQGEFAPISLDKEGKIVWQRDNGTDGSYSYKYSSLGEIIRSVSPALAKACIARASGVKQDNHRVRVASMLIHGSGQWLACELTFMVKSDDPKKIGSAISYGRRYGLSALCGIASEEDDDGDAVTNQNAQKKGGSGSRDRGRGRGNGGQSSDTQKSEALKLIAGVETYDQYQDVCHTLSEGYPRAVLQDQEVRAKTAAAARVVAASDLMQSEDDKHLRKLMSRYPKSIQESENVAAIYSEKSKAFQDVAAQDSTENENQDQR